MTKFPSFLPSLGDSTVALHMENNRISDLHAATWLLRNNSSLSRVKQLYLTNNSLNTFSHMFLPSNLTHLHLDHNSLRHFESQDLAYFHRLLIQNQLKLKLGNNPYDCGCSSREFAAFMKDWGWSGFLLDKGQVTPSCGQHESDNPNIQIDVVEFCPSNPISEMETMFIVVIIILALVVCILLVCICAKDYVISSIKNKMKNLFSVNNLKSEVENSVKI